MTECFISDLYNYQNLVNCTHRKDILIDFGVKKRRWSYETNNLKEKFGFLRISVKKI